jgi:hypothetical protein
MDDPRNENSKRSAALAALVASVLLLFAVLTWGPGNVKHVETNPGPSGTPGSTVKNDTPPPAQGPTGGTVGNAR